MFKRQHAVNDSYFKTFTPNMAYVLGLWFADGYMNKKRNLWSIAQYKDDKYILENILKDMDSNNYIRLNENTCEFSIRSKEIVSDIEKLGGIENKSLSLKFPTNIPLIYMSHFIRGLWDGDGCVSFKTSKNRYISSYISGSKCFAESLLNFLREQIPGFTSSIYKNKDNAWILDLGINDTRRLRDYMYKDCNENSLFLKRKYEKFIAAGAVDDTYSNIEKFVSFEEASIFMQQNKIDEYKKWKEYRKKYKIFNIPTQVHLYYEEYTTWKNFYNLNQ